MQLCFGCLHSFNPSAFEEGKCSFNDEVVMHFEAIRSLATKLQPTTPTARQHVAELEGEIKMLAKTMKLAIEDKNAEIAQLSAQVQFLGDQMEDLIKERQQGLWEATNSNNNTNKTAKKSPRNAAFDFRPTPGMNAKTADALGGSAIASGLLNRFLLASQKMPVSPRGNNVLLSSAVPRSNSAGGGAASSTSGGGFTATVVSRPGTTTSDSAIGGGASGRRRTTMPMNGGAISAAAIKSATTSSLLYKSNVSAALYSLLEALVVKTRADMGVVWVRAPDSDGLAATFTAGRNGRNSRRLTNTGSSAAGGASSSSSTGGVAGLISTPRPPTSGGGGSGIPSPFSPLAPYFIGVNSIPGSVANTGVVLNMAAEVPPLHKQKGARRSMLKGGGAAGTDGLGEDDAKNIFGHDDDDADGDADEEEYPPFTPASEHDLLTNVCTQHSSLTLPIYTRYGSPVVRKTIGVVQLFGGSPAGAPFTVDDERLAEATSTLMSHIMTTHYHALIHDWLSSTYNPSLVTNTAVYHSDIDQRPETKGADGFASPPMFIYRGKYSGTLPPPKKKQQQQRPAGPQQSTNKNANNKGESQTDNGGGFFLTQQQGSSENTSAANNKSNATNGSKHPAPPPPRQLQQQGTTSSTSSSSAPPPPPLPTIRMRNLRCDMVDFSTPFEAYTGLRDVAKYLDELEEMSRNGGGIFGPQMAMMMNANGGGNAAAVTSPMLSDGGSEAANGAFGGVGDGAAGGVTATTSLLPSIQQQPRPNTNTVRGPPLAVRFNPTNAMMMSSSNSGGGGGMLTSNNGNSKARSTAMNMGAIESLEVDTISRLDQLMSESRTRR